MSTIVRLGAMLLGLMLGFASPAALAQGRQGQGRGPEHHGGMHPGGQHFGGVHPGGPHFGGPSHWRGGQWHHGVHGGRIGWWWIVGPTWYFYPGPVYPYPDLWEPDELIMTMPDAMAPAQYWYYCPSSRLYYPDTPVCASGWQQVPAVSDPRTLGPIPQVP